MIKLLKCPLSHKFYRNPYLASIGNQGMTYEKVYIEEYIFNKKNDPTFDKPLKGDLILNYVIKDMVDAIIEMNKNQKEYSIDTESKEKLKKDLIIKEKETDENNNKNNETLSNLITSIVEENEGKNDKLDIQNTEENSINNDNSEIEKK